MARGDEKTHPLSVRESLVRRRLSSISVGVELTPRSRWQRSSRNSSIDQPEPGTVQDEAAAAISGQVVSTNHDGGPSDPILSTTAVDR